jgi:hypothetical protein
MRQKAILVRGNDFNELNKLLEDDWCITMTSATPNQLGMSGIEACCYIILERSR